MWISLLRQRRHNELLVALDNIRQDTKDLKRLAKNMATKQELQAAVDSVNAATSELGKDLRRAVQDLLAQIAAGQDFSAEVEALNAIATRLNEFDAEVEAVSPETPAEPEA